MNCELAAELNNLGASYLQAGYLRKSLELFRDALKYTLDDLHPSQALPQQVGVGLPAKDMDPASPVHVVDASGERRSDHGKLGSEEHLGAAPTARESKPAPSSVPFVHSHAINIIPSPNAYSADELVNTTVVSGIILFNLAVVYHLKGLDGTSESTMRLAKSRSLYQKSLLLLADAGVPPTSTGNPVIDMLCMALYNNLAQASFEMCIYEDSRRYFENLIRFALTVVPARYGDPSIASMVDQQKSNFLLNAIILHAPKLAAAA